jgi:hypothetical protein
VGSIADYPLFLNPDTRLFGDTLAIVTAFMESEQAVTPNKSSTDRPLPDSFPSV